MRERYQPRVKNKNMALLEMVLSLGIFIFVSVFILKMFVGANSIETKAKDISKATIKAESIVEQIKGSDNIKEVAMDMKTSWVEKENQMVLEQFYNKEWQETKKNAIYRITIILDKTCYESQQFIDGTITVIRERQYPNIKQEKEMTLIKLNIKKNQ